MNEAQSQDSRPNDAQVQAGKGQQHGFWPWFWRAFLVVSLAYAWYSFYVPSNEIQWADDYTSALQQSAQSGKPIVMFFTATWCVPCRIMKRQVWSDEQVQSVVNADFVPVMIDVDEPEAAEAMQRYSIGSTPITVITDAEGNVLDHRVGGVSKADFLLLLEWSLDSGVAAKP